MAVSEKIKNIVSRAASLGENLDDLQNVSDEAVLDLIQARIIGLQRAMNDPNCNKCSDTGIIGWTEKQKDWNDNIHTCYREAEWCDCAAGRKAWKDQKVAIQYEFELNRS